MVGALHTRLGKIYYGWWMVAIGSAVRVLAGGLHYYGSTLFFLPVSQELGLSRAATSLVFSLARAQGALEGPLAGYIIDRYGPRPVILAAMFFTGIGYIALSEVYSFTALLLVYMGLISLSYQAGVMDATMAIPANWFVRNRSVAMSWMSASIGLGGFLITPLLAYAIHNWGWRYGALATGIAFVIIGIPVTLPLVRSPESIGLSPERDAPANEKEAKSHDHSREPVQQNGTSFSQTLRTWRFWVLVTATTLRVFCTSTITVHFVPIMTWKGVSEQHAAVLLSIAALLALPAHMIVGFLADRYKRSRVLASTMLVSLLAVVSLIYARQEWHLWIYLVFFSAAEAAFPVTWSAIVDFFGRQNFAKIRGAMSFIYTWGGVAGPVAAGFLYDRTEDYSAMLWTLVAVLAVAAVAYSLLTKPQLPSVQPS
ncbi:MAG: MFS transporter [Candidatus Binatia bacterium]